MTSPAFQVAQNPRERASVAHFALKWLSQRLVVVGSRALLNTFLQEDTPVLIHGRRFYFGLNAGEISVLKEIYLEHAYDALHDFSPQPDWLVLDVGANVGLFSTYCAVHGASVYAFEPNPECYRRLTKTVTANGLQDKITTFNCALARQPGTGSISVPGPYTPSGSVTINAAAPLPHHAPTFPMLPLDQFIANHDIAQVDLLKIDTEGAEVEILAGGQHALEHVQRVVLEYHSMTLREESERLLEDAGFQLWRPDQATTSVQGVLYAWQVPNNTPHPHNS